MQVFRWILLTLSLFSLGCSQRTGFSITHSESSRSLATLSDEIAETSGLACLSDGTFLTVNDSGHQATVFRVNTAGQIIDRWFTEATNQDWEALALHDDKLWIADIGNNSGQRSTLQLYSSLLPTFQTKELAVKTINLRFQQAINKVSEPYQHERDAEALVSTGDQLLIFSKNWTGPRSDVYAVSVNAVDTELNKIGETTVLPGLITDAAYSAQHRVFVVVGYDNFRQNPFPVILYGDFSPFIAVLDSQYRLIGSLPIDTGGQVEAICLDQEQNIWLSQEKSSRQPAQFWRWGALTTLLNKID